MSDDYKSLALPGKKKVLILTADAGFGHRSAANAVAAALQEKYADQCEISLINPMDHRSVPFFLRDGQSDYDKIVRDVPELWRLGYDASDGSIPSAILESALTVFLFEAMRDAIRTYQPDVILTTYPLYLSALEAVFVIYDTHVPLITVVTDLVTVHRLWFYDRVDLCLVPTDIVKNLALESGIPGSKTVVTGIPINPAFSKIDVQKEDLRAKLGWETGLTTIVMVTSKRFRFVNIDKHLQVINHFGAAVQLVIVTGNDETLFEKLQQTEWHIPVKIYPFVENMPEIMKAADIIITKAGGLIVSESMACGLPMILFDVIPGQETGNASYVIDNGAGTLVDSQMDMLEALAHLLMKEGALLKLQSDNSRKLGNPFSAYTTAELVREALSIGRKTNNDEKTNRRPRLIDLLSKNKIQWQDNPFKFMMPK